MAGSRHHHGPKMQNHPRKGEAHLSPPFPQIMCELFSFSHRRFFSPLLFPSCCIWQSWSYFSWKVQGPFGEGSQQSSNALLGNDVGGLNLTIGSLVIFPDLALYVSHAHTCTCLRTNKAWSGGGELASVLTVLEWFSPQLSVDSLHGAHFGVILLHLPACICLRWVG